MKVRLADTVSVRLTCSPSGWPPLWHVHLLGGHHLALFHPVGGQHFEFFTQWVAPFIVPLVLVGRTDVSSTETTNTCSGTR